MKVYEKLHKCKWYSHSCEVCLSVVNREWENMRWRHKELIGLKCHAQEEAPHDWLMMISLLFILYLLPPPTPIPPPLCFLLCLARPVCNCTSACVRLFCAPVCFGSVSIVTPWGVSQWSKECSFTQSLSCMKTHLHPDFLSFRQMHQAIFSNQYKKTWFWGL